MTEQKRDTQKKRDRYFSYVERERKTNKERAREVMRQSMRGRYEDIMVYRNRDGRIEGQSNINKPLVIFKNNWLSIFNGHIL